MPRIENYTRKVSPISGVGGQVAPANTSGVTDFAQEVSAGINEGLRRKEALEKSDGDLWAINTMADFRANQEERFDNAKFNIDPKSDAQGFARGQNQAFEDDLKVYLETAPSSYAKKAFEVAARNYQQRFFSEAMGTEASARASYRERSIQEAAVKESNSILNSISPVDTYKDIATARVLSIQGANLSPDKKNALTNLATNHFSETLVRADAAVDPKLAINRIDSGYYAKLPHWNIHGDDMAKLRASVAQMSGVRSTSLRPQINQAFDDAASRAWLQAQQGQVIEVTLPFDEETMKESLGKEAYKQKTNALVATLRAADKIYDLAHQPIETTVQQIRKWESDVTGAKAGSIDVGAESQAIAQAKRALSEEAVLRAKDPAGAAEREASRLYGVGVWDKMSETDRINARLAIQQGMFGIHASKVQPLPQSQVDSMVANFNSLPPDEVQMQIAILARQFSEPGSHRPNAVFTQVMGQLMNSGLPKGYAFSELFNGTPYGNAYMQALRVKSSDSIAQGLDSSKINDLRKGFSEHPLLRKFAAAASAATGEKSAEYVSAMMNEFMKVGIMSIRSAPSSTAPEIVAAIVKSTIGAKYSVQDTYYIPHVNDNGTRNDPVKVVQRLERIAAERVMDDSGAKFTPDNLSEADYKSPSLLWIPNEDGSGVIRATAVRGAPGKYLPLLMGTRRWEVLFQDTNRLIGALDNPGRMSSGKIQ